MFGLLFCSSSFVIKTCLFLYFVTQTILHDENDKAGVVCKSFASQYGLFHLYNLNNVYEHG
jgi:hypothetical protein